MAIQAGKEGVPPERLPDGRIDEVRFAIANLHAARGHTDGWPACRQEPCRQYLDDYWAARRPAFRPRRGAGA